METLASIRRILRDTLSLGPRAEQLTADSTLLGGLPEFDSMAVVNVIASLENEFGITVNDDEMSAEVFATVGSLARFVANKLAE
jgi:acyl carrier protein